MPAPRSRVLIDSACPLCSSLARFISARDPQHRFDFASGSDPSTLVLLENGQTYTRSTAVLRILSQLPFPWPLLARLARLFPRSLRDAAYDAVARNRRRL
jgi:predicted DCC family thiol-disulfide oxidoreductase YuxK